MKELEIKLYDLEDRQSAWKEAIRWGILEKGKFVNIPCGKYEKRLVEGKIEVEKYFKLSEDENHKLLKSTQDWLVEIKKDLPTLKIYVIKKVTCAASEEYYLMAEISKQDYEKISKLQSPVGKIKDKLKKFCPLSPSSSRINEISRLISK